MATTTARSDILGPWLVQDMAERTVEMEPGYRALSVRFRVHPVDGEDDPFDETEFIAYKRTRGRPLPRHVRPLLVEAYEPDRVRILAMEDL